MSYTYIRSPFSSFPSGRITPSNIGAKPTGTEPVTTGGTGQSSLTLNAILTGNGTSAVKMVATANGAAYATEANGALTFGALPIAQGGTGATSASAARTALGISYSTLGTVSVANGGTGRITLTANRVLVGNGTSNVSLIRSQNGAFYAEAQDGTPKFGTLQIAQGGTGLTSSPSMLTNLGSTSAANVLASSPRPGITGTLAIGHGGTGSVCAWNYPRNLSVIYSHCGKRNNLAQARVRRRNV